jgi:hypothetical protein
MLERTAHMTAEERAVQIVALFEQAREHALAGELPEAVEVGTEAVFLAQQAHDEHRQSFLPEP